MDRKRIATVSRDRTAPLHWRIASRSPWGPLSRVYKLATQPFYSYFGEAVLQKCFIKVLRLFLNTRERTGC